MPESVHRRGAFAEAGGAVGGERAVGITWDLDHVARADRRPREVGLVFVWLLL